MRDHPLHGTTILGSGWGSKLHNPNVREEWKKTWSKWLKDPLARANRTQNGPDQVLLDRCFYSFFKLYHAYLFLNFINKYLFCNQRLPTFFAANEFKN
jgi:hypothetical protein